jgi:diacylglycerol kinase family enzyme
MGLVRAVVAATGAVAAVAIVEAVAPRCRRGAPSEPQIAVVVNIDSGSARMARRALRALRLEPVELVTVDRVRGTELRDALALATARLGPHGRLVAVGGDGTIGTAAAWASQEHVELGVLPTGTGNDIARSIGIPLYPEEAAAVVARGEPHWLDLVETNLGTFAHAAGLGMVAEFAAATRDTKGWRRPLVYPYRSWQAWRRRGPLPIEVAVDGEIVTFPSPPLEIAAVNAPRVGGRIGVTLPGSRADDGLVDLIGLYRGAGRQVIRGLAHYVRARTASSPTGAVVRRGRSIELRLATPRAVSLDGEPAGVVERLHVEVSHRACPVVLPSPRVLQRSSRVALEGKAGEVDS